VAEPRDTRKALSKASPELDAHGGPLGSVVALQTAHFTMFRSNQNVSRSSKPWTSVTGLWA